MNIKSTKLSGVPKGKDPSYYINGIIPSYHIYLIYTYIYQVYNIYSNAFTPLG